jgi:hypothetical protein
LFECAGDVGTFVPGDLQGSLKNICIKTDGLRVKQEDVVTDDLSVKSHLSRALAAIFPNCEKKRVLCEHKGPTVIGIRAHGNWQLLLW